MKKLAIIILDWNGYQDTIECLKDLTNSELYDIFLLDNGSKTENSNKLKQYLLENYSKDRIKIQSSEESFNEDTSAINYIKSNENLGFAVGNNLVANRICSNYKYILLLNNDTVIPQNAIEHMVITAENNNADALTCVINYYYDQEKLWNAGGRFVFYGDRKYFSQRMVDREILKNIDFLSAEFITGCALLIKSSYVCENGLFTEAFFHGEEDFNLCYRMKKKKCIVGVDLGVNIYHKVGNSINKASKSDRTYSTALVHYLNRVIDFKSFYTARKWQIWRFFYLTMVFMKRVCTGMNIISAFKLIKLTKAYSDKNDEVKKPLFEEIMGLMWN